MKSLFVISFGFLLASCGTPERGWKRLDGNSADSNKPKVGTHKVWVESKRTEACGDKTLPQYTCSEYDVSQDEKTAKLLDATSNGCYVSSFAESCGQSLNIGGNLVVKAAGCERVNVFSAETGVKSKTVTTWCYGESCTEQFNEECTAKKG